MDNIPIDLMMKVGGSKVDLTQATHDAHKAADDKAADDAVNKLAIKQDQA